MSKKSETEKINILFIIPQLEKGGSEALVYNVASRLDRDLFSTSVAYFYFYGNEKFRDAFQEKGIRLYHIPKNGAADLSAMRKLARIINENNIHIVNAHHFVSMFYSFYACKIVNRRKLVYTEHSSWEVEQVPLKWKLIGRLLLSQLDCIMGVSNDVTEALREKFNLQKENAITIRNGVDDIEGRKEPRDVREIRNEFDLASDTKVVMTVANFRKVKNHLFLLRGFKELLKEYDNVRLFLIGQGTESDPENSEGDVRSYLEEHNLQDKVILTGHRNDVQDLLLIADVFCLTSYREGLPVSLLEAMSAGLPVIGTNVPGIRDVVVNSKNGFLLDLGDQKGLKTALLKLLNDDKLRLYYGRVSRNIVKEFYSMDQCMRGYQNLFMSLMKRGLR
jgi:glycosyltransferase involved in cell wall biosynthesis